MAKAAAPVWTIEELDENPLLSDAVKAYVMAKYDEDFEAKKTETTILNDIRMLQNAFYTSQIQMNSAKGKDPLKGKSLHEYLTSQNQAKPRFAIDKEIAKRAVWKTS